MNDILSTLYKFIYATFIKFSMLTRDKVLQIRFECQNYRDVLIKITTKQIIHCVKKHFSLYGIPKIILSDCGLQFISHNFSVF